MEDTEEEIVFRSGMENISRVNNRYLNRLFSERREPPMSYSSKRLAIGRDIEGKLIYMDISEGFRAFIIGATRSGKSFLMKAMMDRMQKSGYSIFIASDIKNEFATMHKPIQQKFRHLLADGEKPEGFPVISLRPTFFKTLQGYNNLPKDSVWFSVNLADMQKSDLFTLINADKMTDIQKIELEGLWEKIKKRGKLNSLEEVNDIIDDGEDQSDNEKTAFKRRFKPLLYNKFFVEECCRDILKPMQKGVTFTLMLENFDSFGEDSSGLPVVMMAILIRKILMARKAKQLPRVCIFIDEAARFIRNGWDNVLKNDVMRSYDLDTRFVDYISATQNFKDFPENMRNQSNYIFVPYSADLEAFKDALRTTGICKYHQRLNQDAAAIKQGMKQFQWAMFDRKRLNYTVFLPVCPLSYVEETVKN